MEEIYSLEFGTDDDDDGNFDYSAALFDDAMDQLNSENKSVQLMSASMAPPPEGRASFSLLTETFKNGFSKLDSDNNGYVSHEEVSSARLSDRWFNFSQNERLLINQLFNHDRALQSLSNDEWGWERSGVTLRDMMALEKLASTNRKSELIDAIKSELERPRLSPEDERMVLDVFKQLTTNDLIKGQEAIKASALVAFFDKAKAEGKLVQVGQAVRQVLPGSFRIDYTDAGIPLAYFENPANIHIWTGMYKKETFSGTRQAQNCYTLDFYKAGTSVGGFRVDY